MCVCAGVKQASHPHATICGNASIISVNKRKHRLSTMIASHLLAYYLTELHHDQVQKVSV